MTALVQHKVRVGQNAMRAFILGVLVSIVMAVMAAFILDDVVQRSASTAFSTESVRVGEIGAISDG